MVRTIISLSDEDKAWLDLRAHQESVSMTEVVRRSISLYRETTEPTTSEFASALNETSGLWPSVDALQYQEEQRAAWDERP